MVQPVGCRFRSLGNKIQTFYPSHDTTFQISNGSERERRGEIKGKQISSGEAGMEGGKQRGRQEKEGWTKGLREAGSKRRKELIIEGREAGREAGWDEAREGGRREGNREGHETS